MNKSLCILALSLLCSSQILRAHEQRDERSIDFVRSLQKRYYFIRRLEKPVQILSRLLSSKISFFSWFKKNGAKINNNRAIIFSHPDVRAAVREMQEANTPTPFFTIWGKCLAYKYVEDELFMRETITAILLMYQQILISVLGDDAKELISRSDTCIDCLLNDGKLSATRDAVDVISAASKYIKSGYQEELTSVLAGEHHTAHATSMYQSQEEESLHLSGGFNTLVQLLEDKEKSADFVVSNNIRFYHIQRMLKAIFLLSRSSSYYQNCFVHCFEALNSDIFSHVSIKECIRQVRIKQRLCPFFGVWESFVSYSHINDELFVRDFIKLVVTLCTHCCAHEQEETKSSVQNMQAMLELYQKMDTLPLPELLDLLDDVVDQFGNVVEQYELKSDMAWSSWLQKYWWAPPVIVSSFIITILKSSFFQALVAQQVQASAQTP